MLLEGYSSMSFWRTYYKKLNFFAMLFGRWRRLTVWDSRYWIVSSGP